MTDDTDDRKPERALKALPTLTPSQRKLCDVAALIVDEPSKSKDAAFMARQLVQVTLPHKNPGNVPFWSRRSGNAYLGLQPGYNHQTCECYGYPYGTIPRLLLFWTITEAIRTKSRRLELGGSLNGFMAELGLSPDTGGGKRGDAKRLRDQMERLFNARISFQGQIEEDGRRGEGRLNLSIARKYMLWWSEKDPDRSVLWGSWVELDEEFFKAITAAPVPVDMRALRALKKSPLALDLYAWLAYEAFRAHKIEKARYETWEQLHAHLGSDYADLDNFRKKVKAALAKIRVVFPGLKLGRRQGGIEVLPESLPALQPCGVTMDGECITLLKDEVIHGETVPPLHGETVPPPTVKRYPHSL